MDGHLSISLKQRVPVRPEFLDDLRAHLRRLVQFLGHEVENERVRVRPRAHLENVPRHIDRRRGIQLCVDLPDLDIDARFLVPVRDQRLNPDHVLTWQFLRGGLLQAEKPDLFLERFTITIAGMFRGAAPEAEGAHNVSSKSLATRRSTWIVSFVMRSSIARPRSVLSSINRFRSASVFFCAPSSS